jgi:hypothetical protein
MQACTFFYGENAVGSGHTSIIIAVNGRQSHSQMLQTIESGAHSKKTALAWQEPPLHAAI